MLSQRSIKAIYLSSLPPKSPFLHGDAVEFFFEGGSDLAVVGDIIQVGVNDEAFCLRFGDASEEEYWEREVTTGGSGAVSTPINVCEQWAGLGFQRLLAGPREVLVYGRRDPEPVHGRIAGIEIIAHGYPDERILLVASESDPGDVVVMYPSKEYDQVIVDLIRLNPDLAGGGWHTQAKNA